MTKYKIVTDNGQLYTRNSDKIYTHAVVFTNESGSIQGPMFCARLDLAQKKHCRDGSPVNGQRKYTRCNHDRLIKADC